MAATVTIGNEVLTAESVKNSGNVKGAVKAACEGTAFTYDAMKLFRNISDLAGYGHGVTQATNYLNGTAILRLPAATIGLYQAVTKPNLPLTAHTITDTAHQVFDVATTAAYTAAFIARNPMPFVNVGKELSLFSDATEVASVATQLHDSQKRLDSPEMKTAAPEIQRAVRNEKTYSLLKLIKTITAVVASILAVYLFLIGAPLVPVAVALTIAITSSLFNVIAYYHKNCYCDVLPQISYNPPVKA